MAYVPLPARRKAPTPTSPIPRFIVVIFGVALVVTAVLIPVLLALNIRVDVVEPPGNGTQCSAGQGGETCATCGNGTWSAGGSTAACGACAAGCNDFANSCDRTNGTCIECDVQWTGNCSVCAPGYGTENCTICGNGTWAAGGSLNPCISCANGCNNFADSCNPTNGTCTKCDMGTGGPTCVGCVIEEGGDWSPGGSLDPCISCAEGCNDFNYSCDPNTGQCTGCDVGYHQNETLCSPD